MVHGNPRGYGNYIASHRDETSVERKIVVKFATRYRFAGQLDQVSAHGFEKLTNDIYREALRVALGYSAFEQLMKLPKVRGLASVKIPHIASEFRSGPMEKFRNLLVEGSNLSLRQELLSLIESDKNQNVLPVIKATRNATFHGVLSPGSMGFRSMRGLKFLEGLSQGLFIEMDRLFDLYLQQEKLKKLKSQ